MGVSGGIAASALKHPTACWLAAGAASGFWPVAAATDPLCVSSPASMPDGNLPSMTSSAGLSLSCGTEPELVLELSLSELLLLLLVLPESLELELAVDEEFPLRSAAAAASGSSSASGGCCGTPSHSPSALLVSANTSFPTRLALWSRPKPAAEDATIAGPLTPSVALSAEPGSRGAPGPWTFAEAGRAGPLHQPSGTSAATGVLLLS